MYTFLKIFDDYNFFFINLIKLMEDFKIKFLCIYSMIHCYCREKKRNIVISLTSTTISTVLPKAKFFVT